jgi:DsbC/DsbD-like thiol-disulfide interchange protein
VADARDEAQRSVTLLAMSVSPRSLAFLLPIAVLLPAALHGATSPWQRNPHSEVRLLTPYATAPRQGELRLGVQFRLAPGWHAYWKNPGSAGYPPKFTAETPGLVFLDTRFPAPERFDLPGDLVAFGYAEQVVYPIAARWETPPGATTARLVVDADYLVCEVECVPYRYDLAVDQAVGDEVVPDAENAALLAAWEARVPASIETMPAARAAAALEEEEPGARHLALEVTGIADGAEAEIFFESHPVFDLGRPVAAPSPGGVRFTVPLLQLDRNRPLSGDAEFAWTLSGLDGGGPSAVSGVSRVRLGAAPAAAPGASRSTLGGAILWSSAALAAVAGALFLLNRMRRS